MVQAWVLCVLWVTCTRAIVNACLRTCLRALSAVRTESCKSLHLAVRWFGLGAQLHR